MEELKLLEEGLSLDLQFKKRGGKIPVVFQEGADKLVTGLELCDRSMIESLIAEHIRNVEQNKKTRDRIFVDCDQDALLYFRQAKPTENFFYRESSRVRQLLNRDPEFLLPTIAQDAESKQVLVLGYSNLAAFQKVEETGLFTLWSTSRNRLWTKGEEQSGNTFKVIQTMEQGRAYNPHPGSLLYIVEANRGGMCHTNDARGDARTSCFYRRIYDERTLKF